ncbi:MAG: iron donor protein CyaY [Hyphomicrobiales bacterium]|nr:iron donor protein CyaY [Rickettsiales bacterium]MCP5361518.1 iron donor protein CyaY [Hyphomicrobiales bacterium]
MDESNFHELADEMLERLMDSLEMLEESDIETDLVDGVLTVTLPDGNEIVLNKHAPTAQLWLSSPASGAGYFSYNEDDDIWEDPDGQALEETLSADLNRLAGVEL